MAWRSCHHAAPAMQPARNHQNPSLRIWNFLDDELRLCGSDSGYSRKAVPSRTWLQRKFVTSLSGCNYDYLCYLNLLQLFVPRQQLHHHHDHQRNDHAQEQQQQQQPPQTQPQKLRGRVCRGEETCRSCSFDLLTKPRIVAVFVHKTDSWFLLWFQYVLEEVSQIPWCSSWGLVV